MRCFTPIFLLICCVGISSAADGAAIKPPTPEQALELALAKQRESLEKQRQAVHLQVGEKAHVFASNSRFIDPLGPPAAEQADCPPLENEKLKQLVESAARKQSLDPAVLRAVIRRESGFKPCVVSAKGAQGLMQLMPGTARELRVADVFNPEQNVQAGAAYLKQMLDRYRGDLRLALVAYNAGPVRADQPAGTPYPLETQNYVAAIFADLGLDSQSIPPPLTEELAAKQVAVPVEP